jgi:Acetyl-CoA acetyltransferase
VTVAGGAENMSRSPYSSPAMRFGARMNDTKMVDMMVAALSDPFDDCHMGVTAENVARKYKISRQDQDALAVESHRRAGSAIDQGFFKAQIVPIEIKVKRDKVPFVTDETVRHGTTVEKLAKLPTVFDPEGSVTAGQRIEHQRCGGGPCAGGWRVCQKAGSEADRPPCWLCLCRCRSQVYGYRTGAGRAEAAQKNRLQFDDIDVFEVNEAFAAQALAVCRELNLPAERTNPNGSGISLGHPLGATGAILTVKALYELARTGGKRALVTMCIGGGQGIAAIFERP